jgi:serine phosphatase RsbU (regulator of sigma subunit)
MTGLLCGPLLTALPLWVSSWHLFGSTRSGDYSAELIYSLHPALKSLDNFIDPAILGLFAIAVGFLERAVRKPAISFTLLFVVGTLLFGSNVKPSETSAAPWLLEGVLLFLIYRELFARFDLLAALSAAYSSSVIWSAAAQLLEPARSLHVSGITALGVLSGMTVFAAAVAWRGRELAAPESIGEHILPASQRDSLMAEFSIAHRVQQQMLPENPPEIPGCTIAACCHPAREVGGDLFDFLKLPDGRWTIGVGDVSGKGVPAALYMTLTKGLLVATTADNSDLLDIVANVNEHIHAVTERKTFVTLALGAFDPETRSFEHVRAGHNPIVWRRSSDNATALLNAAGIGLGLAPGRLFRRTTELERLQLSQGDLLVFYSDGLTEAMNSSQEQFGEDRLLQAVAEAGSLDVSGIREFILTRVKTFLNGIPAQDDMTLVVLRVN